jgi:hypothetical protein
VLHLSTLASRTGLTVLGGCMGVPMLSGNGSDREDLLHPSIMHFVNCLSYLKNVHVLLPADVSKRPRALSTKALRELYCEHTPQRPLSQSQCYRINRGELAPSIVQVYEFASIFNVSPQIFLPPIARRSTVYSLLRPRYPQGPNDR